MYNKKELTHKFFQLVMSNYKVNRSVTFYANSLCITPKYLTMVVKEVSGKIRQRLDYGIYDPRIKRITHQLHLEYPRDC